MQLIVAVNWRAMKQGVSKPAAHFVIQRHGHAAGGAEGGEVEQDAVGGVFLHDAHARVAHQVVLERFQLDAQPARNVGYRERPEVRQVRPRADGGELVRVHDDLRAAVGVVVIERQQAAGVYLFLRKRARVEVA